MDIDTFTNEEIEAEYKRRQMENIRPEPLHEELVDIDLIIDVCENYLNFRISPTYDEDEEDSYSTFIKDTVLSSVYGPNVFDFLKSI